MTHVVTDACIKCKYTTCVEVCPVNCFYEGENMVVIDPTECIDCGVCVAECPVNAIQPEGPEHIDMINYASKCSMKWPNITVQKNPLPDADKYKNESNKFQKYAQENS